MDMEDLLNAIRRAYGTHGTFTMSDLWDTIPRDLMPPSAVYALAKSKQGGSTSLAAALRNTGQVEKVSTYSGASLWRMKHVGAGDFQ
jgi:predicted lipoprotein